MSGSAKKSRKGVQSAKAVSGEPKLVIGYLNPRWPIREPKWLTPEEAQLRYPWLNTQADQSTHLGADVESAN